MTRTKPWSRMTPREKWQHWRDARIADGYCTARNRHKAAEGKRRCDLCTAKRARIDQIYRGKDIRLETIRRLGGRCVCCGESNLWFLTLDHIDGNGGKDRGNGDARKAFYRAVMAGKRPDIRVLCYNCNCGRELNGGVCPHTLH